MSWKQQYLPIMEEGRNHILGIFSLGDNVEFTGNETELELPDAPPGGNYVVPIRKITPQQSSIRAVTPEYMAAVFDHETVYNKGHEGYSCFVPIDEVKPASTWVSGSGLANYLYEYNGPVIEGLSRVQGFKNGPPEIE